MNTQQAIPAIQRPTSGTGGIFVIWPGWNIIEHLTAAEAWSKKNGVGACVYLMPGVHEWRECFTFYFIGAILGFAIKSTRIRRYGNGLLKSVWDFPMQDHSPVIGNFEIENMVATSEPAIEIGGQQNAEVSNISSVGKPADLLRIENGEPDPSPPPGRPFGVWTENLTLKRLVIYGPRKSGVSFRVINPGAPGCQSFSNLSLQAQITLVTPGSIGVNFEDHCHAYGGLIALKANIDAAAQGDAVAVNVGPECNITGTEWRSFIEGVPLYGLAPPDPEVIRKAGLRIRVASSARVSGHGKFYRQRESHTPDEIVPGVNYAGEPSGFVKGDVLADEGI